MSACSRCEAQFECGMADARNGEACWCTRMPAAPREKLAVSNDGELQTCLCPACLSTLTLAQRSPPPSR